MGQLWGSPARRDKLSLGHPGGPIRAQLVLILHALAGTVLRPSWPERGAVGAAGGERSGEGGGAARGADGDLPD